LTLVSHACYYPVAGWSSLVARWAHNPKVVGSNPAPATNGPEKDFSTLLDYEWRLEEFLQAHPALCGICQYHADTLPGDALRHGLLTHQSLYINETLSRINPYYVEREAFTVQPHNTTALDTVIRDLCAMPDALMLNSLPPGYLQ
jgi:hypothetical protein